MSLEDAALKEVAKYTTPALWAQEIMKVRIKRITDEIKNDPSNQARFSEPSFFREIYHERRNSHSSLQSRLCECPGNSD